jgi:hypothetical protein
MERGASPNFRILVNQNAGCLGAWDCSVSALAIYQGLTCDFDANRSLYVRKGAQVAGPPSTTNSSYWLLAARRRLAEARERVEVTHQGVTPDIRRAALRRL